MKERMKNYFKYDCITAHSFSSNHKAELEKDTLCGCFACKKIYNPQENVPEWIISNNDADKYGTAVCPFCGIDAVIGESSGFPITDDFLYEMNLCWFESGSTIAHKTPFGNLKILLNDEPVCFEYTAIPKNVTLYPDVVMALRIDIEIAESNEEQTVQYILDTNTMGDVESGERLEALSFYINGGKITIGCEYDDFEGILDYDLSYISNGFEITIPAKAKKQTLHFGAAWLSKCTEDNDVQTWFAGDPTI